MARNSAAVMWMLLTSLPWNIAYDALKRRTRRRVALLRDPARLVAQPAGFERVAHGRGHLHRVLRVGDAGVEQHAVGAELHGDACVARGADAGVDDHRVTGVALLEQLEAERDVERVEHALAGADRRAGGHDA